MRQRSERAQAVSVGGATAAGQAAPASRAFLMSPLLTPSASSLSKGCTAQRRGSSRPVNSGHGAASFAGAALGQPASSAGRHRPWQRPRGARLELLLLLLVLLHDHRLLLHGCHLRFHGCVAELRMSVPSVRWKNGRDCSRGLQHLNSPCGTFLLTPALLAAL